MALPGRLATQAQFQRQAGQAIARNGLEVVQPGGEGADAVESGGAEHEAAQRIFITNQHIEPAIWLTGITFRQRAGIR